MRTVSASGVPKKRSEYRYLCSIGSNAIERISSGAPAAPVPAMPKLYLDTYSRALAGKRVLIACRHGILRDHFAEIIADIKFLHRQRIQTTLIHNIPNRFGNQKLFRQLEERLPFAAIIRVLPEQDFFKTVLDINEDFFKLIIVERKSLLDTDGERINTMTTEAVRTSLVDFESTIANTNYLNALRRICEKIDAGHYDRVHILPAGKEVIRQELFSIEGVGTLIANNFTEVFEPLGADIGEDVIAGILNLYRGEGYLLPRNRAYIDAKRSNFFVTRIDGIIVGCVEKKEIDAETVELGALAISSRFRNHRIGVFTIGAFIDEMRRAGYRRFLSLTNNPVLAGLYQKLGFYPCPGDAFPHRQQQSPGVAMYLLETDGSRGK